MAVRSVLQLSRGEQPHGFINTEVWSKRRD
jgi:hypothetical protein